VAVYFWDVQVLGMRRTFLQWLKTSSESMLDRVSGRRDMEEMVSVRLMVEG